MVNKELKDIMIRLPKTHGPKKAWVYAGFAPIDRGDEGLNAVIKLNEKLGREIAYAPIVYRFRTIGFAVYAKPRSPNDRTNLLALLKNAKYLV